VSDFDGLLERLRAAGIEIITKAEWDQTDIGRFARIHDPEGNAIELWEPPAPKT
jgi:predicted enzyme related to lactoylglutathione lyase